MLQKTVKMDKESMIVVIGSSNTDMVMQVREFPRPGETVMGCGFLQNQGGKGANQAVACARLGAETSFVGKLGCDLLAQNTISLLRQEGIDVSHLTQTSESPSGTAFIMVDSHGENSIIVNSGANACLTEADINSATPLIARASVVLMQLESPVPVLTHAARVAKKNDAIVVLNPAPAPSSPLPDELLKHVDILIPNQTETERLSGVMVKDDETLLQAIHRLQEMGVGQVVVTLGSRGAMTVIDGQPLMVPSFKVEAVDTTAAGDTFCGALCVRLSQGSSIEEAMRFACKAASLTVTRMGAQQSIPYLSEIAAL